MFSKSYRKSMTLQKFQIIKGGLLYTRTEYMYTMFLFVEDNIYR